MDSKCFILSGPSGAGKGTLIRELKKLCDIGVSISHTTRAPRVGERDGIDYHFVSEAAFEETAREEGFLEYARYGQSFYGTPRKWVESMLNHGKDVILEIDCVGNAQVREKLSDSAVSIFLKVSPEILRQRLMRRGKDDEASIKTRLRIAEGEFIRSQDREEFDWVIENSGSPEEGAMKVCDYIKLCHHTAWMS